MCERNNTRDELDQARSRGALLGGTVLAQAVSVDKELPKYEKTTGVSGNIKSVGSDTMNNMMTLWAEGFKRIYPNVNVEIEGKGSGTAPPALIEGSSTFGPMSRKAKSEEAAEFEKAFGYKLTQLATGIDMLAVYVHKDNPIKRPERCKQVDSIFSKAALKRGHGKDITQVG